MYFERIIDAQTGEETIREFTANEIAELEASRAQGEAQRAIELEEAKAKAEARAQILDRLGLTDEEASILLG